MTLAAADGALRTDERLGSPDRLPDEPADPGAGRHVRSRWSPRPAGRRWPRSTSRMPRRCPAPARSRRRARHRRPSGGAARLRSSPTAAPATAAGVPGGVTGGDLPSIFRSADLSPLVLLVSILTAAALGRRPRADAGPRQDADGRLPRRDARDAAPRGRPRPVGDALAHARDPGPGRARGRCPGVPAAGPRRRVGAGRRGRLDRRDRRLDADRRGPARWRLRAAEAAHAQAHAHGDDHEHDARAHDHDARAPTTTRRRHDARRAQPRRRQPQPPAAGRDDHLVAQPVRPRPRRRPDPVDQRAADPARLDRGRAAGVRVRAGRRVRARDGARHGRDRAGARPRPRPPRSRRLGVAARSGDRVRAARRGGPRLRPRALPDGPGGRRQHDASEAADRRGMPSASATTMVDRPSVVRDRSARLRRPCET